MAAGGEVLLLAGWLDVTLTTDLRLAEDESEETREALPAGARVALERQARKRRRRAEATRARPRRRGNSFCTPDLPYRGLTRLLAIWSPGAR
jgi:hypothetical protein